jgi:hypothetical protein
MSVLRSILCPLCGGLGVLVASTAPFTPDHVPAPPPPAQTPPEANRPDPNTPEAACIEAPSCVDGYLWSVYRRKPTAFSWKDATAADKAGMSPSEFVVGGMDPAFRTTLYRALHTLDLFGFRPGITCGFRDDYRQSITTGGKKAKSDRSFHGGSAHGGYGHGQAADIVSTKDGATERMYAFIDRHEQALGIGRPYLRGDPPHVAALDGEEYTIHRLAIARARGQLPPVAGLLHDPPHTVLDDPRPTVLRPRGMDRSPTALGYLHQSAPAP